MEATESKERQRKTKKKMIDLTVDGRKASVAEGKTVLDAAQKAEIYIPTLCSHADLSPFGGCRLCIVEIEGMKGFPTSCTMPAAEGMVVHTNTEKVRELRKGVLELLLTEHPHACLVCERKLECWNSHECIRRAEITTGCKFCPSTGKCELQTVNHHISEGGETRVSFPFSYRNIPLERHDPFFDRDYNLCVLCGRCIRVCEEISMAAVLDFTHRGSDVRVGTPFNRSHMDCACRFCGACVDVCPTGALSERVNRWEGPAESQVRTTCSYCGTGCQFNLGVKNGRVIEALPRKEGEVNKGQACVRGRFSVVEFIRSPRRVRSPLVRRKGELVEVPWETALNAVAEGFRRTKPERSALVYSGSCTNEDVYAIHKFAREVLLTSNVDSSLRLSYGPLMSLKGVSSDAARIEDVRQARTILVVGGNPAFSHPVLAQEIKKAVKKRGASLVLFHFCESELVPFSKCWVRCRPGEEGRAVEDLLARLSLKDGRSCGEDIARAAEVLQEGGPAVIVYGASLMRHSEGAANMDSLAELAKLLSARTMPLLSRCNDRGVKEIAAIPGNGGLATPEIFRDCLSGKIEFLYLIGEDIWPGSLKTRFVVVQDMFLPAQAGRIADVVLPAASFVEIDGTYTNIEGRVQRVRKAVRAEGVSKPDWEILSMVARKLGVPGFEYSQSAEVMADLAEKVPFFRGVSYDVLEKEDFFFGTDSRAGSPVEALAGNPGRQAGAPLRELPEQPDKDYPFSMFGRFEEYAYKGTPLGSEVKGINRLFDETAVVVSSHDAREMGLASGALVEVASRRGKVVARAVASDCPPRGVVKMVSHHGDNSPVVLMSGVLDPVSKVPEEVCAVRIRKL